MSVKLLGNWASDDRSNLHNCRAAKTKKWLFWPQGRSRLFQIRPQPLGSPRIMLPSHRQDIHWPPRAGSLPPNQHRERHCKVLNVCVCVCVSKKGWFKEKIAGGRSRSELKYFGLKQSGVLTGLLISATQTKQSVCHRESINLRLH